ASPRWPPAAPTPCGWATGAGPGAGSGPSARATSTPSTTSLERLPSWSASPSSRSTSPRKSPGSRCSPGAGRPAIKARPPAVDIFEVATLAPVPPDGRLKFGYLTRRVPPAAVTHLVFGDVTPQAG